MSNPFLTNKEKPKEGNPFLTGRKKASDTEGNPFLTGERAKKPKVQVGKDKSSFAETLKSKKPTAREKLGIGIPLLNAFEPVTKRLGLKDPKEYTKNLPGLKQRPEGFTPAFLRGLARGTVGQVANIAATPSTFVAPALGKAALSSQAPRAFLQKHFPTVAKRALMTTDPEYIRYQKWLKNPTTSPTVEKLIRAQKDPIGKVTRALRAAKPIRAEQEKLYTAARSKLAGRIEDIGKQTKGEEGFYKQLGALKGKLPKVQYEGIRDKVTQTDIDDIFNMVQDNAGIAPFEKIAAKNALIKVLGGEGGVVPTKGELRLLGEIFPKEFISTVLSKRGFLQKAGEVTTEIINIPRAIMSSTDVSAPFRQGIFLINKPKRFIPAFKEMFKYLFSDKAYNNLMTDIKRRPTYFLMKKTRLALTDISAKLTGREEAFMSSYAEKLPLAGRIIKASNRAYTGFLNKMRADVFDDLVNSARKLGHNIEGRAGRDIARFINSATGRGELPKAIEGAAGALNATFFSPRLMASRLNLLNPRYYQKLHPFARKEALKSLGTLTGVAATVLSMAKLAGAEVGTDPRSADFGKIKVGNTRYDILGGFQQYIRLGAQLWTGEHISSTTGVKTTVGEGYKPMNRMEIIGRFLESKHAPITSFAVSLMKGKGRFGQRLNVGKELGQRFTPMVIQDMYDLIQDRGPNGIGMNIPAFFGVGVQTYSPTAADVVRSTNSVMRNINLLTKQGRIEEAQKLRDKNKDMIIMGLKLGPIQEIINQQEKYIDEVVKNVRLPEETKKKFIKKINKTIDKLEKKIKDRFNKLKSQ